MIIPRYYGLTITYSAGYIDDVAVFSNTWKEHLRQLKEILSKLPQSWPHT